MVCEVEPAPQEPVRFTWYHANRQVGSQAQLRLDSLTYPDIGLYVCRAEWTPSFARGGSMSANATVELSLALTRESMIGM